MRSPAENEAALARIAVQEAAHALIAATLGEPPTRARLEQEPGITQFETRYRARNQAGIADHVVRNRIVTTLAGCAAEHLVFGEGSLGSETDLVKANELAKALALAAGALAAGATSEATGTTGEATQAPEATA